MSPISYDQNKQFNALAAHEARTGSSKLRKDHSGDTSNHIKLLQEYKSEFGDLLVPQNYKIHINGNLVNLGRWVNWTRQKYKKGKVDDEMKIKLNLLGFVWKTRNRATPRDVDDYIKLLKEYKSEFGDLQVPPSYKINRNDNAVNLGQWVSRVRQRNTKGDLNEEFKSLLDSLGFVWKIRNGAAPRVDHDYIKLLQEYESEFGDLQVPFSYKINTTGNAVNLGQWVSRVRQRNTKGELEKDLRQQLDSMGFIWDAIAFRSAERSKLLSFKPLVVPTANSKGFKRKHNGHLFRTADQQPRPTPSYVEEDHGTKENNTFKIERAQNTPDSTQFHTPAPKRRKFWRPPTPYPPSDDEQSA